MVSRDNGIKKITNPLMPGIPYKEAPVAQWVKHWPTDLAFQGSSPTVPGSSPTRGEIFSIINRFLLRSLSFSSAHHADMTEILLNRTFKRSDEQNAAAEQSLRFSNKKLEEAVPSGILVNGYIFRGNNSIFFNKKENSLEQILSFKDKSLLYRTHPQSLLVL